jgi:hypothetical protein
MVGVFTGFTCSFTGNEGLFTGFTGSFTGNAASVYRNHPYVYRKTLAFTGFAATVYRIYRLVYRKWGAVYRKRATCLGWLK